MTPRPRIKPLSHGRAELRSPGLAPIRLSAWEAEFIFALMCHWELGRAQALAIMWPSGSKVPAYADLEPGHRLNNLRGKLARVGLGIKGRGWKMGWGLVFDGQKGPRKGAGDGAGPKSGEIIPAKPRAPAMQTFAGTQVAPPDRRTPECIDNAFLAPCTVRP